MARNLITRTIKSSTVTMLCMNIDTTEACNQSMTFTSTFKNTAAAEKAFRKASTLPDNIKPVTVVDLVVTEQLYGITEEDFLAHAHVINK